MLSYNRMISDIFYPIFTLMITVLAYFNVWGFCTDIFTKALPWDPGGLTATPSCYCFWLGQKLMRPYFSCIIPWEVIQVMIFISSMFNRTMQWILFFVKVWWLGLIFKGLGYILQIICVKYWTKLICCAQNLWPMVNVIWKLIPV